MAPAEPHRDAIAETAAVQGRDLLFSLGQPDDRVEFLTEAAQRAGFPFVAIARNDRAEKPDRADLDFPANFGLPVTSRPPTATLRVTLLPHVPSAAAGTVRTGEPPVRPDAHGTDLQRGHGSTGHGHCLARRRRPARRRGTGSR